MGRTATPSDIRYYEGLIRKTAAMYGPHIQEDYDDIVAILRIKVWRSIEVYDSSRSSQPIDRFVFSCVKNQVKDLLKRRRRDEVYLEDQPQGTGDGRLDPDVVYAEVERELPCVPNTLTDLERAVLIRLYLSLTQREVSVALRLSRSEMEKTMRSLRLKMADWQPTRQVTARAAA